MERLDPQLTILLRTHGAHLGEKMDMLNLNTLEMIMELVVSKYNLHMLFSEKLHVIQKY